MPKITTDYPIVGVKTQVCEDILRALPEWFGIEDAIHHYVQSAHELPTIFAYSDGHIAGFLTLKQHSPASSEIYVMGVYPQYHRQGIGKIMVERAEAFLREKSVQFLQVKTLSASHPDKFYARTRRFYESVGFHHLEEFPTLWGESNPCLLLIKSLT